jgi:NAD(P)-dependent dehydrogenase (short-subunit alcohol dehydrogenase family)
MLFTDLARGVDGKVVHANRGVIFVKAGVRATRWTAAGIPGQQGRTIVISGASTGVGLETAKILAGRGVAIVLACHDPGRAAGAMERVSAGAPQANVESITLDLASLAPVCAAAAELRSGLEQLTRGCPVGPVHCVVDENVAVADFCFCAPDGTFQGVRVSQIELPRDGGCTGVDRIVAAISSAASMFMR